MTPDLPPACEPVAPKRRYLTNEAKSQYVSRWLTLIAELPPDFQERPLEGWPDPPMFGWCARINALPGLCTVQSCSGHRLSEDHYASGQLWIAVTETVAERFRERAFELALHPNVERLRTLYSDWGEEVIDITFRGHERGALDESMRAIAAFLEGIADDL